MKLCLLLQYEFKVNGISLLKMKGDIIRGGMVKT